MLRHKLLMILFSLTALLMVLAVTALWSLQRVFVELDHLNSNAAVVVRQVNELNTALSGIEVELYALQSGRQNHLDRLIGSVQAVRDLSEQLDEHYVLQDAAIRPAYREMVDHLDGFETIVGVLATSQDRQLALAHNLGALDIAAQMRRHLLEIGRHVQDHSQSEQAALTGRFRWLVVAMAVGFLIVINASILLLLRTAGMILRPVDRLVQASRELANGNFAHRVTLGQVDEFDELAQAYNDLAGQLEEKERNRIETLQQTALTLNHELNNAIEIIELQLSLLRRQSSGDEAFEGRLRQIHDNLQRMARVVGSLKNLRRVVLTDYVGGVKMLDLAESIREDEPAATKR